MTVFSYQPGGTEDWITDVDVLPAADGGFITTWTRWDREFRTYPGSSTPSLAIASIKEELQRFDAAGRPIGSAVTIGSIAADGFRGAIGAAPRLAHAADGDVLVAHVPEVLTPLGEAYDMADPGNAVVVSRFGNGSATGLSKVVVRITPGGPEDFVTDVDIAGVTDGGFILTWALWDRGPVTRPGATEPTTVILSVAEQMQRFDATGHALAPPTTLSHVKADAFGNMISAAPHLGVAADGDVLVAFVPDRVAAGNVTAPGNEIVVQRFADGNAGGSARMVLHFKPGDSDDYVTDVDVAGTPDGGFNLTWTLWDRSSTTSPGSTVPTLSIVSTAEYIQHFTSAGRAVGNPVALNVTEARGFSDIIGSAPRMGSSSGGITATAFAPEVVNSYGAVEPGNTVSIDFVPRPVLFLDFDTKLANRYVVVPGPMFGADETGLVTVPGEEPLGHFTDAQKDQLVHLVQGILDRSGIKILVTREAPKEIFYESVRFTSSEKWYFHNLFPARVEGNAPGDFFDRDKAGVAAVFMDGSDDMADVAATAAHEAGHLWGLIHAVPSELWPQEVMDYEKSSLPQFTAKPIPASDATSGTDETAGLTQNAVYHIRRYVVGDTDAQLRAEGILPGTHDIRLPTIQNMELKVSGMAGSLKEVRLLVGTGQDVPLLQTIGRDVRTDDIVSFSVQKGVSYKLVGSRTDDAVIDVTISLDRALPDGSQVVRIVQLDPDRMGEVTIGGGSVHVASESLVQNRFVGFVPTAGADYLRGGVGNDVLVGLAGNDTLLGLGGNDTLVGGEGKDTLNGGDGVDTLDLSAATGAVGVDLRKAGAQTIGADQGRDIVLNIENVTGSAFNDRLIGTDGVNTLRGGAGNDQLLGLGGADTLDGGAGDDVLDGGAGADTMWGGAGNDTYVVDDAGDVVREDRTAGVDDGGTDQVTASVSFTLGAFVENLVLTGAAALTGTGNALTNRLTGNDEANLLSGLDGNDVLQGGRGADTLLGGEGDDLFLGADAGDVIDGGAGSDTLDMSRLASRSWVYLDGTDQRGVARANAYAAAGTTITGVENVTGSATANDAYWGDAGANRLLGLGGNDRLYGKGGNDTLQGGDGNDVLSGGAGADDLYGGAGADQFLLDTVPVAAEADRIVDFGAGVDKLVISRTAFGIAPDVTPGLVVSDVPRATATGPVFLYDNAGNAAGALYFDPDGLGGADAVRFARLSDVAPLTSADFLFTT